MEYKTNENIDDEVDKDELYELDKTILDENKVRKIASERELKNIYDIKITNDMNF